MGRACFPLLCLQVQNLPCRTRPPTENICDPGPRSSVMRSPFIIGKPRYKHSIYNIVCYSLEFPIPLATLGIWCKSSRIFEQILVSAGIHHVAKNSSSPGSEL
eukprot:6288186-Prorocentrum_lima.AAC.1